MFAMMKPRFYKLDKFLMQLYNTSRMSIHEALNLISVDPWKSIKILFALYSLNIIVFDFHNDDVLLSEEYKNLLDKTST